MLLFKFCVHFGCTIVVFYWFFLFLLALSYASCCIEHWAKIISLGINIVLSYLITLKDHDSFRKWEYCSLSEWWLKSSVKSTDGKVRMSSSCTEQRVINNNETKFSRVAHSTRIVLKGGNWKKGKLGTQEYHSLSTILLPIRHRNLEKEKAEERQAGLECCDDRCQRRGG